MTVESEIERSFQHQAPAGSLFETFGEQVVRRVQDVLTGRDCLYPIGVRETLVLHVLLNHRGEDRAVARAVWVQRLGIQDRILRELVQSLRQDFGIAIGTAKDGGYFLIATREEFDDTIRSLTLHAVTTLRVAKGMSGGHHDELLQQLRLQLSGKEPF